MGYLSNIPRFRPSEMEVATLQAFGTIGQGAALGIGGLLKTAKLIGTEARINRRNAIAFSQANASPFKVKEKGLFGRKLMPQERAFSRLEGAIHGGRQIGFGGRTAGQHLGMGFFRAAETIPITGIGVGALGISAGLSLWNTDYDQMLSARNGFARI